MDKKACRLALLSTIRFLEAIPPHLPSVLEHPFKFEDIGNACQERAEFLRTLLSGRRREHYAPIRRRLFDTNGRFCQELQLVDGVPKTKYGVTVRKPNGQPWTQEDTKLAFAQLKQRENTHGRSAR